MRVEKNVDHWLGPDEKDEEITPILPRENAIHLHARSQSKFYGEWGYFDARLEDGHVVVGFFQASELLSQSPEAELHIYNTGPTEKSSRLSKSLLIRTESVQKAMRRLVGAEPLLR